VEELNSHNWLDILDHLSEEYNAGYHRTIKYYLSNGVILDEIKYN